ncbi:MAG: CPBP family glutamic-type intramembrane protease [Thermoguttaceae bacterium]
MKLTFTDLFLMFALWTALGAMAVLVTAPSDDVAVHNDVANTSPQHPLESLIRQRPTLEVFLVVFIVAVVIGPITEEFLWRLVFQGTLLRYEQTQFVASRGMLSVFVTALLFAARHFRPANVPIPSWEWLWSATIAQAVASLVFLACGVGYFVATKRVTVPHIRRTVRHIPRDVRLALVTFLWLGPLTLFIHVVLQRCFPGVVLDPIPLFVFAVGLGELARRTGRLTASITLHVALNATSLAMM